MRILVTNDDGIHGPGLKVLENIARTLSDDVWVVAPDVERSGAGHSLTLSHPLRYRHIEGRHYEVSGTPTDCVIMACRKIMPGMPDLLLSGVNRGQNIADDVTYSGTIAAAMEGTSLGIKSIAMSQVTGIHDNGLNFAVAAAHGAEIVKTLMKLEFGPGILVNVNFPDCRVADVAGTEITSQGKRDQNYLTVDERKDNRSEPYYWLGFTRDKGIPPAGTDLAAVFNRKISVTPLHMNLTQLSLMAKLKDAFKA
ncbi:5'/3'-nucleotidase SurE [Aestuariivirga litoralis]|uniref:5'/3'-nucleotidase SurE n=1 Tax=Aestuariivirga litoralis TaxID=2650924 RepID=UPI0018C520D8|nr:5'/3'-nucleotidase SurE [Aestuariivirga litoralis]MBG1231402.1 5'/3'-nucleotidase SurE [Aestuariivirga litoralis]